MPPSPADIAQWCDISPIQAPPMPVCRYVEEMATKRSVSVTPQVKHRPPPSTNKASHPGPVETSPEVQNRDISGPTKGLMSSNFFKKKYWYQTFLKNLSQYLDTYESFLYLTCKNKMQYASVYVSIEFSSNTQS